MGGDWRPGKISASALGPWFLIVFKQIECGFKARRTIFFWGCNWYFEWFWVPKTDQHILLGRFYFTVKQLWILGMFGDISVLYLPISDWCVIARFIPHDCVLAVHYYPPSLYSSAHPTLGMCISCFYQTYVYIYIYIHMIIHVYTHNCTHVFYVCCMYVCIYIFVLYTLTHICHIFTRMEAAWHSSGFFYSCVCPHVWGGVSALGRGRGKGWEDNPVAVQLVEGISLW